MLREIRRLLPNENLLYFADQAHVPYGPREMQEVRSFSQHITHFLMQHDAKMIVVACNTASAAALHALRAQHPGMPFVGMEPAVKPAAQQTKTRRVGVLATPATFQGQLFASVVERFASDVDVIEQTFPGLVERIEAGDLDGPETRRLLEPPLRRLLQQNVDTLVLGCTHYPFVIPLIRSLVPEEVQVIDPSPAIARQTQRLLQAGRNLNTQSSKGSLKLFTTADASALAEMVNGLIGEQVEAIPVTWIGSHIARQ